MAQLIPAQFCFLCGAYHITMKRYLLWLLFIAATCCAQAQPQWKWAKRDLSTYNVNPTYPHQVLAATGGNAFWGVLLNRKISYSGMAMGDNALYELDSSGNVMASLIVNGKIGLVQAQADAAGNWYVLGTFYDSVSLNSSLYFTRSISSTSNSYFLFRLHAHTLAPDWLQLIGVPTGSNNTAACFTIANNKLFVPVDSLVSTHVYSFDLATGAATRLWTQAGRSSTSLIQADSAGNIYLIGSCVLNGPLNFNGITPAAPGGGSYPWYIVRYHANGQYHWHYYLTDITCTNRSLILKGNNELYLSGALLDSTSLGSYQFNKPPSLFNSDYILARLDSSGNLIWAQQRPVTSITQGSVFLNSQFQTAVVDTTLYLFCESSGNSIWGSGIATSTNNHHLSTLVSYNSNTGAPLSAKTINGLFTSGQHIISDGLNIWVTGNGNDSSALSFDTVSVPTPGPGIYVPYVAKMQVGTKKTSTPPGTSVQNAQPLSDIKVWPNPSKGYVMISGLSGKETLTIRDITGRILTRAEAQAVVRKD